MIARPLLPAPIATSQPARATHPIGRRVSALVPLVSMLMVACGGGSAQMREAPAVVDEGPSATTRYTTALRLAALARVEARAGLDEVAAEHFRAAWRSHPDAEFLIAYARSAERARLYAEAHEALSRALYHRLSADERQRLEGEVARLRSLVPPDVVRVAVLVRPETARVQLTPAGSDDGRRSRLVLGSGHIFLQPGVWNIETHAKGHQSHLLTFQVRPGADVLNIALKPDDAGSPALVETRRPEPDVARADPEDPAPSPIAPEARRVPIPDTEPGAEPVRATPRPGPTVEIGVRQPLPRKSALHRYGPLVTAGAGVVAVGVGGWFGYQAQLNAEAANGLDPKHKRYKSDLAFYADAAESAVLNANLMFAAGGALLLGGTAWWLLAPSSSSAVVGGPGPADATAGVSKAPSLVPRFSFSPDRLVLDWSF